MNLLIIRSKGQATALSISPFILILALIFAAAFITVSVVVMNRYYMLYYDHKELMAAYEINAKELHRHRSLYAYQSSVAAEYAKIMNAMNRADPQSGQDISVPAIGELPPENDPETEVQNTGEIPVINSLDTWAALFPDPAPEPEQTLDVDELQFSGRNFKFQLINAADDNSQAQGRLLMVFAVEDEEGRVILATYPEFDVTSSNPDFNMGPGYNIRSSKQISGRLDLPANGVVLEMMVIGKARSGQVVLKKKIAPPRRSEDF